MKIKNLICSYSFWTALAGALAMLGSAIGKAFSVNVEGELISDIVMSVAGVLVAVGVVTMPKKDSTVSQDESEQTADSQSDEQKDENL